MNPVYYRLRRSPALAWLIDNPLLVREIRRRMRGRLFSWSLIGYIIALGAVSCAIMFVSFPFGTRLSLRDMMQAVGEIGGSLFTGMCLLEGFIGIFIAPMLTAGVATAEKERDTFDFLRVTTLRARTFVIGCLLTTACFLLLVFSCTLPVLGLTFIFGGVSMGRILTFNLTLFLTSMVISAFGVFNSTNYSRSRTVHGSMIVVIFIVLFFGYSVLNRLYFRFATTAALGSGTDWFQILLYLALALATALFTLTASRRLYDPNNRLFSYKTYTALVLIVLGGFGGYLAAAAASPVGPPPPDRVTLYLGAYLASGLILSAVGVVCFTAGRIERGDEVWNIRARFPVFRSIHEDILFHALWLAMVLVPAWLLADRYDTTREFAGLLIASVPVILSAWLMLIALSRLASCFTVTRNAAMGLASLALLILWGVVPAAGWFIENGSDPGDAWRTLGFAMGACSPLPEAVRIWSGSASDASLFPVLCMTTLAGIFAAVSFAPVLRGRLKVSYLWNMTPPGVADSAPTNG